MRAAVTAYRLEAIAGPPVATRTTTGTTTINSTPVISLYAVIDITNFTGTDWTMTACCTADSGGLRVDNIAPNGSSVLRARFDDADGNTNIIAGSASGAVHPGIIVAASGIAVDRTSIWIQVGDTRITKPIAPSTISFSRLQLRGNATRTCLWTGVWSSTHTTETTSVILRWLKDRYRFGA